LGASRTVRRIQFYVTLVRKWKRTILQTNDQNHPKIDTYLSGLKIAKTKRIF
jgi:hypothetical protein